MVAVKILQIEQDVPHVLKGYSSIVSLGNVKFAQISYQIVDSSINIGQTCYNSSICNICNQNYSLSLDKSECVFISDQVDNTLLDFHLYIEDNHRPVVSDYEIRTLLFFNKLHPLYFETLPIRPIGYKSLFSVVEKNTALVLESFLYIEKDKAFLHINLTKGIYAEEFTLVISSKVNTTEVFETSSLRLRERSFEFKLSSLQHVRSASPMESGQITGSIFTRTSQLAHTSNIIFGVVSLDPSSNPLISLSQSTKILIRYRFVNLQFGELLDTFLENAGRDFDPNSKMPDSIILHQIGSKAKFSVYKISIRVMESYGLVVILYFASWALKLISLALYYNAEKKKFIGSKLARFIVIQRNLHIIAINSALTDSSFVALRSIFYTKRLPESGLYIIDKVISFSLMVLLIIDVNYIFWSSIDNTKIESKVTKSNTEEKMNNTKNQNRSYLEGIRKEIENSLQNTTDDKNSPSLNKSLVSRRKALRKIRNGIPKVIPFGLLNKEEAGKLGFKKIYCMKETLENLRFNYAIREFQLKPIDSRKFGFLLSQISSSVMLYRLLITQSVIVGLYQHPTLSVLICLALEIGSFIWEMVTIMRSNIFKSKLFTLYRLTTALGSLAFLTIVAIIDYRIMQGHSSRFDNLFLQQVGIYCHVLTFFISLTISSLMVIRRIYLFVKMKISMRREIDYDNIDPQTIEFRWEAETATKFSVLEYKEDFRSPYYSPFKRVRSKRRVQRESSSRLPNADENRSGRETPFSKSRLRVRRKISMPRGPVFPIK